ncbi:TolC family protein [Telmatobacter sp. DSM 110680]|uniref:TolC family protein n=1 Tax=Telmatobacter sp. DSM 110680 TaxID=3036704 RepID=A0AAU7DQT2_9BACT
MNSKVNDLKKTPGTPIATRIIAGAAILLLQANMALAFQSEATNAPPQTAPQATTTLQTAPAVPFNEMLHHSFNPFDAYRGKIVPPPSLSNSMRMNSLVRDGKLYLSLRNAIDLALENNLDIVIARYNLPIAQMDILRTQAGGFTRGVNTGVVSGTPGGAASGTGTGSGAGGTSTGSGGAGAGSGGLVQSTFGVGSNVSSFDPYIIAKAYNDHTSQQLTNQTLYGVSAYHQNENLADISYQQFFPTGTYFETDFNNNRQTSNSPNNTLNPQLYSNLQVIFQQQLLAGFGTGPNLRYLRIARTNQKIGDIAFKAQIIATVTQICNIYWDLVNAYDTEQVGERSVAFATETLDTSRKQLELQAIPEMDVLKAESEVATRQQDLTVARTNLELQELYMKNAITRSFDDPVLQELPVVPTDHLAAQIQPQTEPVQQSITDALKNRTEIQENALDLSNRELTRKSARNNLLPQLSLYGFYSGTAFGGVPNPAFAGSNTAPGGYGGTLENALNNSSPEYQVGLQLQMPLRNRQAKADQYRTELEYRQSQVYAEELKKNIVIEVRNARYAVEQGASRVGAAKQARDLAQRTLNIMQQEQKLGAGSNQQTLSAEHDLSVAESALVTAQTAYEKARIQLKFATGSVLEEYGISITDAKTGVVQADNN